MALWLMLSGGMVVVFSSLLVSTERLSYGIRPKCDASGPLLCSRVSLSPHLTLRASILMAERASSLPPFLAEIYSSGGGCRHFTVAAAPPKSTGSLSPQNPSFPPPLEYHTSFSTRRTAHLSWSTTLTVPIFADTTLTSSRERSKQSNLAGKPIG